MRWLVALDESEFSERILGWMRTFLHPKHTTVTVVHAPGCAGDGRCQGARTRASATGGDGGDVAASSRTFLQQSFETVEVVLCEGVPSQKILHLIQEHRPHLVVSGMRGFYHTAGLAFGRVSQRLLAYAPCSLMLVPGKVTQGGGLRVMLATESRLSRY